LLGLALNGVRLRLFDIVLCYPDITKDKLENIFPFMLDTLWTGCPLYFVHVAACIRKYESYPDLPQRLEELPQVMKFYDSLPLKEITLNAKASKYFRKYPMSERLMGRFAKALNFKTPFQ
jgi:hypothetical protein